MRNCDNQDCDNHQVKDLFCILAPLVIQKTSNHFEGLILLLAGYSRNTELNGPLQFTLLIAKKKICLYGKKDFISKNEYYSKIVETVELFGALQIEMSEF